MEERIPFPSNPLERNVVLFNQDGEVVDVDLRVDDFEDWEDYIEQGYVPIGHDEANDLYDSFRLADL